MNDADKFEFLIAYSLFLI